MKDIVKILGAYGAKSENHSTTCYQVEENICIDAGNLIGALGKKAKEIEHIFITHSHFDHIIDLPLVIDTFFENREVPLRIYGSTETLYNLKEHIFNHSIWPEFQNIQLIDSPHPAIEFHEIKMGQIYSFENCTIKPVATNHTKGSCGYVVVKNDFGIFFTSDTYSSDTVWEEINQNSKIQSVVIDVSFPSRFEALANVSKHLTPKLLLKELETKLQKEVKIFVNHLKPSYEKEIKQEIESLFSQKYQVRIVESGDIIELSKQRIYKTPQKKDSYIEELNQIGYSLTSEKNLDILMDKILTSAKKLTNADAGTFYLMSDDENSLKFTAVQTDSLNFRLGGIYGEVPWPALKLYDENGKKNNINISVYCALHDTLINIPDVYHSTKYSFEGAKAFDQSTNYRTKSMLVVPMKNHENDVIGVLQLINKQDEEGNFCEFTKEDENLILSLASQAAVIVTNTKLTQSLEELLDAFMKSIATAIGEKSKYTAGHINRVAEITMMIAHAINNEQEDPRYKDIFFSEDQLKELEVAAWMHDIGKITTPEYVIDKSKKLETIYDRMNTIQVKMELLKKEKELEFYKNYHLYSEEQRIKLHNKLEQDLQKLDEELQFLINTNQGGEFMAEEKIQRVKDIAQYTLEIDGKVETLLNEDEVKNLTIKKGTLTDEERFVINNHAKISYDMLASLPYPKKFQRVPSIAGGHHEKICGGGYPFGLKGDEISLEARILAIADIFEALTASDRPYKKPNSLSTSMKILSFMAKDEELDRDLIDFFVKKEIYLQYANENLQPSQIDEVKIDQ